MPPNISVDRGLLKQYGLPTALLFAILGPLFGVFVWLVQSELTDLRRQRDADRAVIKAIGDDVDFLSRTVDLSCRPEKPSPP